MGSETGAGGQRTTSRIRVSNWGRMSTGGSSISELGFFGDRIGLHLKMTSEHVHRSVFDQKHTLSATRLICSKKDRERTAPVPTEAAFSILHQLADLDRHACWLGGRQRYSGAFASGTVSVINLEDSPSCEFRGQFDAIQFYVPLQALDTIAQEHEAKTPVTLAWRRDVKDPIVTGLSQLLLFAAQTDPEHTQLLRDQLSITMLVHFAEAYGGMCAKGALASGGLAPWQERRAKELMHARIGSPLTIGAIAAECKLTPSHFARAFRNSTGYAPHQYFNKLRLDEAMRLMRTTQLSLADIAIACGFGDQSYFTRVFSRVVGISPAAWRRQYRTE